MFAVSFFMYEEFVMKNKIIGILLATSMIVGLCACGNKDDGSRERQSRNQTSDSTDISLDVNVDPANPVEPADSLSENERFLRCEDYVYFIDEEGNVTDSINYAELLEEQYGPSASLADVCGKKLIIEVYSYDDVDYTTKYDVYYYDAETGENGSIESFDGAASCRAIGDSVYVENSYYVGDVYEYNTYKYTFEEDGSITSKTALEGLNQKRTTNDLYLTTYNNANRTDAESIEYLADEKDLVVGAIDNNIAICDGNGEVKTMVTTDGTDSDVYIAELYNEQYIIIKSYTIGEYNKYIYYVYDMESGTLDFLMDENSNLELVSLCGDQLYCSEDNGDNSYYANKTIYAYDLKNGSYNELYSAGRAGGYSRCYYPGVDGFRIIDGDIYYIADDATASWYYRYDTDGDAINEVVSAYTYDFLNYCYVNNAYNIVTCSEHDLPVSKAYAEWPVFYNSVAAADAINQDLEDYFTNAVYNYSAEAPDDTCEYFHNEDDMFYGACDEVTYTVAGVSLPVDGKYVAVCIDGYDYFAGAAHGMPYTVDRLYDSYTGESLEFSDIYEGTEEEFKALVATAAYDDYENGEIADLVWAESADDLYNTVYEEVTVVGAWVTYYDTYLTYNFGAYDLGPFASGIMSFSVSYDALGIE